NEVYPVRRHHFPERPRAAFPLDEDGPVSVPDDQLVVHRAEPPVEGQLDLGGRKERGPALALARKAALNGSLRQHTMGLHKTKRRMCLHVLLLTRNARPPAPARLWQASSRAEGGSLAFPVVSGLFSLWPWTARSIPKRCAPPSP